MSKILTAALILLGLCANPMVHSSAGADDAQRKKETKKVQPFPLFTGIRSFAPSNDEISIDILLYSRAVQMEIKLTADQAKKIDAIWSRYSTRFRPVMLKIRNTRDPVRRAQLHEVFETIYREKMLEIRAELSRAQVKRLLEIAVQHGDIRALLLPDVAEALGLDLEVKLFIKTILDQMKTSDVRLEEENQQLKNREIQNFPGKDWEKFRKSKPYLEQEERYRQAVAANHAEAKQLILGNLTNEQRKRFDQLHGAPFDPEKYRAAYDKEPKQK